MRQDKTVVFVTGRITSTTVPIYEKMLSMGYNVKLVLPQKCISYLNPSLPHRGIFLLPHWTKIVRTPADLYVALDREPVAPKNKTILHFHGIGLEGHSKSDEGYKAIFLPGPKWLEEYKRVFSPKHWHKLKAIGFPPVERLFSSDIHKKAVKLREELSLGGRKTVLFGVWAETNKAESTLIDQSLTKLEYIAEELDINLLVKPRLIPSKCKRYTEFEKRIACKSNLYFFSPSTDILPLLRISDVLVSGRGSSIINEFMTLDKPVIQVVDSAWPRFFKVGLRCELGQLKECIKQSLKNPSEFSNDRIKWVNNIIYRPIEGTVDRAVEEITKLLT